RGDELLDRAAAIHVDAERARQPAEVFLIVEVLVPLAAPPQRSRRSVDAGDVRAVGVMPNQPVNDAAIELSRRGDRLVANIQLAWDMLRRFAQLQRPYHAPRQAVQACARGPGCGELPCDHDCSPSPGTAVPLPLPLPLPFDFCARLIEGARSKPISVRLS